MDRYLLDTSVVSELRKLKPHGAVLAWIRSLKDEQMFLSAVTLGELQIGIEKTRRQDETKASAIEEWLNQLTVWYQILPMDTACFREWARRPAGILEDAMIAATARVHGLTVATRNIRDFQELNVELFNPFQFA